jgi:hypothetical protein
VKNPVSALPQTPSLVVLGCHVEVQCEDALTHALLVANYGYFQDSSGPAALQYIVGRQAGQCCFFIIRAGQEPLTASDPGEFLFLFEKDMTVELQRKRCDLYFVHAVVLEFKHTAFILVGESGSEGSWSQQ